MLPCVVAFGLGACAASRCCAGHSSNKAFACDPTPHGTHRPARTRRHLRRDVSEICIAHSTQHSPHFPQWCLCSTTRLLAPASSFPPHPQARVCGSAHRCCMVLSAPRERKGRCGHVLCCANKRSFTSASPLYHILVVCNPPSLSRLSTQPKQTPITLIAAVRTSLSSHSCLPACLVVGCAVN